MKTIQIILIIGLQAVSWFIHSQTYSDLNKLESTSVEVYYSSGFKERAISISTRSENAMNYLENLIGFTPKVSLFILNQEDWGKYATVPLYGMPHYNNEEQLIVAAEDNPFWKSFVSPNDEFSEEVSKNIKNTYTNADGDISMMPFFDLLALHELGHGFHIQGGLTMQRLWMQELFCNILLHTYIAENEPEKLTGLELFPEIVISKGTSQMEYTQLSDFETLYDNMNPNNYGWFQLKFHAASKEMYEEGGAELLVKLWNVLKNQSDKLNDEAFIKLLQAEVHPSVADMFLNWNDKL